MPKVSIIVPIYNAEEYLDRSIQSLIKQTLEEIEIILINDGSTDNGLNICERYAIQDKRIKIIDKINGGVSSARNKGIKEATGKYIAFMDADDYIDVDMYKSMYETIKQYDSDLCCCGYIQQDKGCEIKKSNDIGKNIISEKEIQNEVIKNMIGSEKLGEEADSKFPRSLWTYLYKKEIIDKNDIKFEENLPIGEDFLFNIRYMSNISNMAINNGCYYHYFINDGSAMQKYRDNWWQIYKILIKKIEMELEKTGKIDEYTYRLNCMKVNSFIGAIINETHRNNNKKYQDKIRILKEISREKMIETALKEIKIDNLSILRKIWTKLLRNRGIVILYWYYKFRH